MREELQLLGVDAELAGAGAEQVAFHADDVADIQHLEELEIALAHGVFLDVDLQALAVLLQVREAGLAHVADGHDAAGDAHAHLRRQFFGGLGAILRQDLGNGVGELEPAAVGRGIPAPRFRECASRRCLSKSSSRDKSGLLWRK